RLARAGASLDRRRSRLARRRARAHLEVAEGVLMPEVGAEGKRARIEFHEQQRGEFTNVYLDKVEALPEDEDAQASSVDEVAWKTAMDAAPYLLPGDAAEREIPADELFEKLQPFKERVAEDIESSD